MDEGMQSIKAFWRWFTDHQEELKMGNYSQDVYLKLMATLRNIHPSLVTDLVLHDEGLKELIISAGGQKDALPMAMRVADAAPKLKGWKVRAFRPRRHGHFRVEMEGQSLGTDQAFYLLEDRIDDGLYLYIYIIDYDPLDDVQRQLATMLVTNVVGEYEVMVTLKELVILPLPIEPPGELQPLVHLAARMDTELAAASN